MKYYYLINGKIMSANDKMPQGEDYVSLNPTHFNKLDFDIDAKQWLNSLQPCEISESELCLILSNVTKLDYDNPIEVTDIVRLEEIKTITKSGTITDYQLFFKHHKQVEEIEAVEFARWKDDLYVFMLSKKGYMEYDGDSTQLYSLEQLYETFKTRNNK